jgi:hypothetical protein
LLSECSLIARLERIKTITKQQGLLDDNSTVEPPEPIPNSEVKRSRADGSVGFPHVRVGHRQALILKIPDSSLCRGFFLLVKKLNMRSVKALDHLAFGR